MSPRDCLDAGREGRIELSFVLELPVSRCRHGDEASLIHPGVGDAAHGGVRLARGAWVCASVLAGDPREQFDFRGGEATEPILLDLLRKAIRSGSDPIGGVGSGGIAAEGRDEAKGDMV